MIIISSSSSSIAITAYALVYYVTVHYDHYYLKRTRKK